MICELTSRQKWLYRAIRNKISIEDLVQTSTATSASSSATNNLMNIVMQFRKVRWGARVWLRCIAEIWVGSSSHPLSLDKMLKCRPLFIPLYYSSIRISEFLLQVCNHPELFERHEVTSPLNLSVEPFLLPKLIFREGRQRLYRQ